MLDLMTLHTTQRKQYVCWSDQSNHGVGTQQETGREMRNLISFVQEFRYLGHVMTADCRDDKAIKKTIHEAKRCWEYAGQEVLICTH